MDEHLLDTGLGESLIELADDAKLPLVVLDLSTLNFSVQSFIEVLFRLWTRFAGMAEEPFRHLRTTPHCAGRPRSRT